MTGILAKEGFNYQDMESGNDRCIQADKAVVPASGVSAVNIKKILSNEVDNSTVQSFEPSCGPGQHIVCAFSAL